MLRQNHHKLLQPIEQPKISKHNMSFQARVIWTLSNLLLLTGVYLLLYVVGIYTQIEYFRLAARGDTDMEAPQLVIDPVAPSLVESANPPPFSVPILNGDGRVSGHIPNEDQATHTSRVERLIIPGINVDSKVVEVGWKVETQGEQQIAIWEVAEYAVGQHKGSANPGEDNNIVLAGHVGGYGKVFKDLFYIKPGDEIIVYSEGKQYLYVAKDHLVVDEEGVSAEQRLENAKYIGPTNSEVVTLITCWPPKGPNRFKQRVIVQAVPYNPISNNAIDSPNNWTIR